MGTQSDLQPLENLHCEQGTSIHSFVHSSPTFSELEAREGEEDGECRGCDKCVAAPRQGARAQEEALARRGGRRGGGRAVSQSLSL